MIDEKSVSEGVGRLREIAITLESTYNIVRQFEAIGVNKICTDDSLNCPYSFAENYENPYAHLDATYFRMQKIARFFAKLMENNFENKFLFKLFQNIKNS